MTPLEQLHKQVTSWYEYKDTLYEDQVAEKMEISKDNLNAYLPLIRAGPYDRNMIRGILFMLDDWHEHREKKKKEVMER